MKKILLAIIISLISQSVFSQSTVNDGLLQVYPPNSYALARYGDIPVNYSTGIPDISIPLMSISDKDIAVNLSLSYHAIGIKVDQEATWVGLGWVLNAGGVITRDIRGKADQSEQQRLVIADFVPNYSDYQKSFESYLNTEVFKMQRLAHPGEFTDGESDIYYYNFNGKSGKFFLSNDNTVCLFKHDHLKIGTTDNQGNKQFTITDDLGIKYLFDKASSIVQEGKVYETSWYLTKIVSPSGGEINFEYKNAASNVATKRVHSVCFIDATTITGILTIPKETHHGADLIESSVNEPLLSKITTKSGCYINLSASAENRKDCKNSTGKSLNRISLYNAKNELEKGIELNYGYFEANTARRYRNRNNQEDSKFGYLNYRLRLESVKEFSKTNEYAYSYRFEYYGDNNPATNDVYTLPYRLSPCQDHWGYYNNSYNLVIFPGNSNKYIEVDPWFEVYRQSGSLGQYPYIDLDGSSHTITGGADREPDAEAAKACTLNKIIYPTGGYTKFDFEVNSQSTSIKSGLRVKQTETCDDNGKIIKKKFSYSGLNENFGYYIDPYKNYYHTYYYNPILYTPGPMGAHNTYNFDTLRGVLVLLGVPPAMVYSNGYNISYTTTSNGTYLRAVKIDGTSPLRLGLEGEIAYNIVTEETEGLGKTEYHYTNCTNQYDSAIIMDNESVIKNDAFITGWVHTLDSYWTSKSYSRMNSNSFIFPYPNSIDNGWKNRLLTCKRIFDTNGGLVAEDSISYGTKLLHVVPNHKAIQLSEYEYLYTRSYVIGGVVNISKEVNRLYHPDGSVIRTYKEYDYLSPYHKKVTEIRTGSSLGEKISEKYFYPTEYGTYFETLTQKNILPPIDTRTYRNGKLVSGIQVQYDANGLPLTRYEYELTETDIAFDKFRPFTFTPYLWNSYNTAGLLISQKIRENAASVYLWSYGGQYPIAEIRNATYTDVENTLGKPLIDRLLIALEPTTADLNTVNGLRSNLPNAHVITYTYKPLVGMLTSTNPNGIVTTYEYDAFGRLAGIKDAEGKTLQNFTYKYKQ